MITSTIAATVCASGHSARLLPIKSTITATARAAPMRSMKRVSSTLPTKPQAPNQKNSALTSAGLAPSTCL